MKKLSWLKEEKILIEGEVYKKLKVGNYKIFYNVKNKKIHKC